MFDEIEVLSKEDLIKIIGVSRSTIARWEKAGTFPSRLRLGPNRVGYLRSEIENWIKQLQPANDDRFATESKRPVDRPEPRTSSLAAVQTASASLQHRQKGQHDGSK